MNEEKCVMCGRVIPEEGTGCPMCEDSEPNFDLPKIRVALSKITDVRDFVNLALQCSGDVVVRSGNFAINAKSLMGLFSLDLTKPLSVEFYGKIPYDAKKGMEKFIIN